VERGGRPPDVDPVILLIPDGYSPAVQQFADELHRRTVVLQPTDLCAVGWRFDPQDPGDARLVADGGVHRVSELDAIVCALPLVTPATLPFVHEEDRAYVAAELTALLTAVLATARCPVLNPPRGGCLSGPGWPPETWAVLARQVGVPTWPLRRAPESNPQPPSRRTPSSESAEPDAVVTVCGCQVVERDADGALVDQTRRLAESCGVPLLTTTFRQRGGVPLLTGVLPMPDLTRPGLAAAVTRHLRGCGA
jgi:hypothetical protein